MPIKKIVSGCEPGAERGALEAALGCNIRYGGWCVREVGAKDGGIPARYRLAEIPDGDRLSCIEANVIDSDATLVFSLGCPRAEERLAVELASKWRKPSYLVVSEEDTASGREDAAERIEDWLNGQGEQGKDAPPQKCVLHVTGLGEGHGYFSRNVMKEVLRRVNPECRRIPPWTDPSPAKSATARYEELSAQYEEAKTLIYQGDLHEARAMLNKFLQQDFRPWHVIRRAELVTAKLSSPSSDESLYLEGALRLSAQLAGPSNCPQCKYLARVYCLAEYSDSPWPYFDNNLQNGLRVEKRNFGELNTEKSLALLLSKHLAVHMPQANLADCMALVPGDPDPFASRTFGDLREIANVLERYSMIPLARDLLDRARSTNGLDELPPAKRRSALTDCFFVPIGRRESVRDLKVLLVGDALRSGATMDACALRLRLAGASEVYGCAMALISGP